MPQRFAIVTFYDYLRIGIMIDKKTLASAPVPLLKRQGEGFNDVFLQTLHSCTEYWLYQDAGESYYLRWWQCGWVVQYQESFLCRTLEFKHKSDIGGFEHSRIALSGQWEHVYIDREQAIQTFKDYVLQLYNAD